MKTTTRHLLPCIAIMSIMGISGSLTAATVTYNTNASGTGFGGASLSLNSSSGAQASITFSPNGNTVTGTPSNVNYGFFTLLCDTCSTQALSGGAIFSAFSFQLIVTDVTDGATGVFNGSSAGGAVFSDVSQVSIAWVPLVLGPGLTNVTTGSFGPTTFTINRTTPIVAPNSGASVGLSTVEGTVNSSDVVVDPAVPEPATIGLFGAALIGLFSMRKHLK